MQRLVMVLIILCGLSLLGGVTFLTLRLLAESKMVPLELTGQLEGVADIDGEIRRFLVLRAGMPVDAPVAYRNLRVSVRCRAGGFAVEEVLATLTAGSSVQTIGISRGRVEQIAARKVAGGEPAPTTFVPADVLVDLRQVAASLPLPEGDGEVTFDLSLAVDGAGLRWLIADARGVVGTVPAGQEPAAGPGAAPVAPSPAAGGKEDWL